MLGIVCDLLDDVFHHSMGRQGLCYWSIYLQWSDGILGPVADLCTLLFSSLLYSVFVDGGNKDEITLLKKAHNYFASS